MFKARFLILAATFLTVFSCSVLPEGNLTIGLILPYSRSAGGGRGIQGIHYASAITIAVDNINKDPNLLPGIRLSFIWDDSECIEEKSIQAFISQWQRKVDGFIGFGCNCHTQARLAAALNLPMVSHVSIDIFLEKIHLERMKIVKITKISLTFKPCPISVLDYITEYLIYFSYARYVMETRPQTVTKQLRVSVWIPETC